MAEYTGREWKDHLEDTAGQVIQEGTPLSAKNLNEMEQGIKQANVTAGAAQKAVQETGVEVTNIKKSVESVTTQLADTAKRSDLSRIDNSKLPSLLPEKLRKIKNKLSFPTGFAWTDAPINIFKNALGEITTDFDVSVFEPITEGKTYYVSLNGNANNDGLTLETALATIFQAIAKTDGSTILVDEGYYTFEKASNQANFNRTVSIKAIPGKDVTISTRAILNFTKTSGQTNVYQASRTNVGVVYDGSILNEYGDYTKLAIKGSIAEVDATPGSYYYASPLLYVHPLNSRVPDNNIFVFLSLYNLRNTGNHTTYTEGIKWHGGNNGSAYIATTGTGQNPLFVAKNCEFKYSNEGNGGLTILGCDARLENCIASSNFRDGFNYHISNGRVNKVIEINCKGFLNGIGRGVHEDNGSTIHDGGTIIRLSGEYFANEGPNVHDVSVGTQSWNIDVESHHSLSSVPARNTNYQIENGTMWLDSCIGYGSNRAYGVPNGVLNIRNVLFDDNSVKSVTNTGVQAYY